MKKENRIQLKSARFLAAACILALAAGLLQWPGNASAGGEEASKEYRFFAGLGEAAAYKAEELLEKECSTDKNGIDFLVLTNAGWAEAAGRPTLACLDGLAEALPVSAGKGTLLSVHSSPSQRLWFFFADMKSGVSVYVRTNPESIDAPGLSAGEKPFLAPVVKNIRAEKILADPRAAHAEIFKSKAFSGNEFRLIGLANLVMKDAPPGLVRAALFHDHFCPGVTAGFFLASYVKSRFPLTEEYSSYFVLSAPVYCKDDAITAILNATPGKRAYGGIHMTRADRKNLRKGAENIAGVFFRWNGDKSGPKGEGMALSLDFSEARENCGWGENTPWNWWEARLRMNLWFLDHIKKPERFVEEIQVRGKKRFMLKDLPGISSPGELMRPGINPAKKLGLFTKKDK